MLESQLHGLDEFYSASQKWHKKRRYKIGEVNPAVAKTPGTQNVVYEVVYVDPIDPKYANIRTNSKII